MNETFFVCGASNSVCAVFKRNNWILCRHGLLQLKRFKANDLHIFDFHMSEFPSKNVRFFILEKYTQKYYFRPLKKVNTQKHGVEANYNIACSVQKPTRWRLRLVSIWSQIAIRSAIVCDHMETYFYDCLRSCDRDRRRSQKIEHKGWFPYYRGSQIPDHNKVCDRLRSCDRDRRRSQKIKPCSISCDRLRFPAIIWKPKFCDPRSKRIP